MCVIRISDAPGLCVYIDFHIFPDVLQVRVLLWGDRHSSSSLLPPSAMLLISVLRP